MPPPSSPAHTRVWSTSTSHARHVDLSSTTSAICALQEAKYPRSWISAVSGSALALLYQNRAHHQFPKASALCLAHTRLSWSYGIVQDLHVLHVTLVHRICLSPQTSSHSAPVWFFISKLLLLLVFVCLLRLFPAPLSPHLERSRVYSAFQVCIHVPQSFSLTLGGFRHLSMMQRYPSVRALMMSNFCR